MTPIGVTVAITGAGIAGTGAYRAARAHTGSIVLIEGGRYGTTCARVGCMPSNLLIAAAEVARQTRQARHAAPFGVHVNGVRIDGAVVMQRVQRERDRFVGFVLESVEAIAPAERLVARVRFQPSNTLVTADGQTIHVQRIVIATGSIPVVVPVLKALPAPVEEPEPARIARFAQESGRLRSRCAGDGTGTGHEPPGRARQGVRRGWCVGATQRLIRCADP